MNINYNKLRGGDYVEGVCRPANRDINVSGIIIKVAETYKLVKIKCRNYNAVVKFDDIEVYESVLQSVFAEFDFANRVLVARNRIKEIFVLYDRKNKVPKKSRYKIVHKIGK